MPNGDTNLQVYDAPEVVKYYVNASGLQPSEIYAFDKYIPDGARILDIGIGGGRTTPYLCAKASHYLGVDYAQAMVVACQQRFPDIAFRCEDATNMASIADASFDSAVFSCNGIDSIPTDEGRRTCFAEVFRVLKPGGRFIFSSHNAKVLGIWPIFEGVGPVKMGWRVLRAVGKSAQLATRQLRGDAYYRSAGYVLDPVHGGLTLYTSTPATIEPEVRLAGFKLVETIDVLYPKKLPTFLVGWYYYVLSKP